MPVSSLITQAVTTPIRPLRILMLAPEPFFEPRGTPFSEFHRIKALGELGHHVDLVTYPIGRDVDLPNLRIFRSPRPPFVTRVKIGPSAAKVVLDALMLFTIARRALAGGYDAIHSHEEMGLVGVWLAKLMRIPHLYDMHSSLPQQLSNFKFSGSQALRAVFDAAETRMVGGSDVVITICQELQDTVTAMGHGDRSILIENVMGGDVDQPPTLTRAGIRERWGLPADAPIVLYTGTFEAYQGLDLLIAAAALLQRTPSGRARAGRGRRPGPGRARRSARPPPRASATVVFTGQQPAREIPAFVADGGGAGLAAHPRHQHAAQDLLVPALGHAHRGHQPAHAHPGARSRGGTAGAARAGAVCRGHRRAARRSGRGPGAGRGRPPALGRALQPRGLPAPHRRGHEPPGRAVAAARRRRSAKEPADAVKVLVTGATGFTGGHLARHLAARGHEVRALVRGRSLARFADLAAAGRGRDGE